MKISVITPIYNGNRYLNNYLCMIEKSISKINDVEIIWINDSPQIPLKYDEELAKKMELVIIENENNCGIHKSRINGLKIAKGDYILFLDQDDEIMEETLINQYNKIQGYDLIIGNGYYEDQAGDHPIFQNKKAQDFATRKNPYLRVRDFIVSPGQCLIKKNAIPNIWINNTLKNNGTDDYLLWLLMFNNKCKITSNYQYIYRHKYTGENLSLLEDKMFNSQLELLEILQKNNSYNRKDLKKLERTIYYKHNYKKNFFIQTLKNIDIFAYNIMYRLIWKGYRVSNGKKG